MGLNTSDCHTNDDALVMFKFVLWFATEHTRLPRSSLLRKMVQCSIKLWPLAIATLTLVRWILCHSV